MYSLFTIINIIINASIVIMILRGVDVNNSPGINNAVQLLPALEDTMCEL